MVLASDYCRTRKMKTGDNSLSLFYYPVLIRVMITLSGEVIDE